MAINKVTSEKSCLISYGNIPVFFATTGINSEILRIDGKSGDPCNHRIECNSSNWVGEMNCCIIYEDQLLHGPKNEVFWRYYK